MGSVSFDGRDLSFTDPASGDAAVDEIATGRQWAVTAGGAGRNLHDSEGVAVALPAIGVPPERLTSIPPNLHDLRLHPAGRRIAFTGGEARSEVWRMEHLLPP